MNLIYQSLLFLLFIILEDALYPGKLDTSRLKMFPPEVPQSANFKCAVLISAFLIGYSNESEICNAQGGPPFFEMQVCPEPKLL